MKYMTLRMAWRNLGRNRRRTLLALGAIALGQLTLVFINGLMAGSYNQMLRTITGPMVGHVQIHQGQWRKERAMDLFVDHLADVESAVRSVEGVTAVLPRIYAPVLAASGEQTQEPAEAQPAIVVGLDVTAEAKDEGLLGALPADELPGGTAVVLGEVLAARLGVQAGQSLAVIGQDVDGFPVANLFTIRAVIDSSVDLIKTQGILMAITEAGPFFGMHDQAHEIVVRGSDYREAGGLAQKLSQLQVLASDEVLPWYDVVPGLAKIIDMKSWVDLVFLGVIFVAAAAGIANTAMMSTFERVHEFGMLLALGAAPGRIVRMVLIESVLLGLIGVVIGSVIGMAIVLTTAHTGINYAILAGAKVEDIAFGGISVSYIIYPEFEPRYVLFGIAAVMMTSIAAASWPALVAARLEPVEAMRS
jgi:ABC-type lipoprotein release transport system permease subunit